MIPTPQPHPLRCETCKFAEDVFKDGHKYCQKIPSGESLIITTYANWISKVGCASHGSSGNTGDKVLEKAWVRIETMAPYEGIHLGWVLLSDVKAVLNGLRQQESIEKKGGREG